MGRTWNLANKDLKLLWRDKAALFWVLAFPLFMGIIFGSIFGGDGDGASASKVGVVDQDASKESQALVGRLKKSEAVKLSTLTVEQAKGAVRKGDLSAYLLIPKGYGEADRQFRNSEMPLKLGIDPSRKAEAGMLQGVVAEAAYGGMAEKFSDPTGMSASARDAIESIVSAPNMSDSDKASTKRFLGELERFSASGAASSSQGQGFGMQGPKIETETVSAAGSKPASAFEVSFPQALVWGILGVVSTFAISIVKERQQGTMVRLRVSPMTFSEILAGKGMACFLAVAAVMTLLLVVGNLVFGVRLGAPHLIALAIVASAVCFVGVMMLLSVLGKTEQAVAGSSWGVLIMMAMFGGGMVPVFVMPGWMQTVSNFSPIKWSVLSVEGAIWRGFTLQEMMLPVAVLVGVGIVSFAIGVRVLAKARD